MIECPVCHDLWPARYRYCPNLHHGRGKEPTYRVALYPTANDLAAMGKVRRRPTLRGGGGSGRGADPT